ncbi:hypothetical protein LTR97_004373 [Elasticomyces elasticus]|uniref:Uncharacterized protein n=1 Tax=Elasticomyces elasticus TaxID=574655 RepID=A0AAN8A286_9PEZI|nr:hypothetical protein LTR97_004373 [Elasticomyces elasticus]
MSATNNTSGESSLFVQDTANRVILMAEPAVKLERVADAATGGTTTNRVTTTTVAKEPIDLEEFTDPVWVTTLERFCEREQVFANIRGAYKQVFMKIAILVENRGKTEKALKMQIHDTGLAIGGASKVVFRDRVAKHWPNLLVRAKKVLSDDVERVEKMEDEFIDVREETIFGQIVAARRNKLATVEKGIQRALNLVADLEKAMRW